MKTILDQNANLDKATNYNFGWMGGFCGRDITNYPIYLTFIVSYLAKILIQCIACIVCILFTSIIVTRTVSMKYYSLSVIFLAFGILFFMRAYSDYKTIKTSYKNLIEKSNPSSG